MRIYGSDISPSKKADALDKSKAQAPEKSAKVRDINSAKGRANETVVLSKRAAELAGAVAADDAAREARVDEVKLAIENGSYEVDFDQLSERLIDEELARSGGGS